LSNLKSSEVIFDLDLKKKEIAAIDQDLASPDIWKNQSRVQTLQQNKKRLGRTLQSYSQIEEKKDELDVCLELVDEGENVEDEIVHILNDFTFCVKRSRTSDSFF